MDAEEIITLKMTSQEHLGNFPCLMQCGPKYEAESAGTHG